MPRQLPTTPAFQSQPLFSASSVSVLFSDVRSAYRAPRKSPLTMVPLSL